MALTTNINSYADVAEVLSRVIASGEIAQYELPTVGAAVKWVQRAYTYRKLLIRQLAATSAIKNFNPPTPYDNMKLIREENIVTIIPVVQPAGKLTIAGQPVDVTVKLTVSPESMPTSSEMSDADAALLVEALDLSAIKGA